MFTDGSIATSKGHPAFMAVIGRQRGPASLRRPPRVRADAYVGVMSAQSRDVVRWPDAHSDTTVVANGAMIDNVSALVGPITCLQAKARRTPVAEPSPGTM
jgi:hypothetical protein